MKVRECKDCKAEGREGKPLEAPYSGPRCYFHSKKRIREVREAVAARRRAETFGISDDQYRAIIEAQGGGCGWCGRKPYKGGKRLAVDHDHSCCPGRESCGKCVRGALCGECNWHIQYLKDDPVMVERGAAYLRNPPARVALGVASNARTG